MKLLANGLQLACNMLAEPEASEAKKACKRLGEFQAVRLGRSCDKLCPTYEKIERSIRFKQGNAYMNQIAA